MSADPPPPAGLSHTAAAEPAAAAASTPAAGSKRRASHDASAALNAVEHQGPSGSRMDDTPSAAVGSSSTVLAAAHQPPAAATPVHLDSAAATRKKQRVDQSVAVPAPAVTTPPWSRLYSDALHSIFKFASLVDLARLMSVSRRWGEAVLTTPPVAAPAFIRIAAQFHGLLDSRVRRHVTALLQRGGSKGELFRLLAVQLQRASVHVPWLSKLALDSIRTVDQGPITDALPRFRTLCHVSLTLSGLLPPSASNRIIQAIGGLNPATMQTLKLELLCDPHRISFGQLAALTQLRVFKLDFPESSQLSDAQICELRALTSLQQLTAPNTGNSPTNFLARMLQPGHTLQWIQLAASLVHVTEPLAAVLGSLSTLTTLKAWMDCADIRYFVHLTRLTDLEFDGLDSTVEPATLVSSLSHCSRLSRLNLRNVDCASQHLHELLLAFPRLSSLTLTALPQLKSLRCIATPALAASLTSLTLTWLRRCPPSELSHLLGLRSLRDIRMEIMSRPLTAADVSAFCMPSPRFPALRESVLPEESEEE